MNSILGFRKQLKYGRFHRRLLGSCEFILKRNAIIFKIFLKKIMHKIEAYEYMLLSYCYNSITAYYCNILLPYCKNIVTILPNIYYNISLKIYIATIFCYNIILSNYYIVTILYWCNILLRYWWNILSQYIATIFCDNYLKILHWYNIAVIFCDNILLNILLQYCYNI